jgi:hypothetical protein
LLNHNLFIDPLALSSQADIKFTKIKVIEKLKALFKSLTKTEIKSVDLQVAVV